LLRDSGNLDEDVETLAPILEAMLTSLPFDEKYFGGREQEVMLRAVTSSLRARYINALKIDPDNHSSYIALDPRLARELTLLKELVWYYVIDSQQLSTQQYGKSETLKFLFAVHLEAIQSRRWNAVLPKRRREQLAELVDADNPSSVVRLVCDFISSLTDAEAHFMTLRLRGIDSGRFTDRMPL
jgi:dGTP triphosphohydrolase